ncbi:hypothetical protein Pint_01853 [Pistacia integerrima]|uniref:Uncharacterized protein n=1 Tax=Pistacia integerrima TaxID=434235 RepID=A0ACC0ZNF8_9ROSI|nr:hypothetical protein Pint_01853 [Pistacia integerrima]
MGLSLYFFAFVHIVFCFLLFHLIAVTASIQPLCHDDERSALLQFKDSLTLNKSASIDPSAYPKTASWKLEKENGDCCSWEGIKCNEDTGHVFSLDLASSFLYGSIHSDSTLFQLVHLEWLSLADNHFNHSKIPSEILNLSRLSHLNLSLSALSGNVLSHIPQLSKLVLLNLSNNSFSGTIPSSIGNLTKLLYLDLSVNNFFGELPASLGSIGVLEQLDVNTNNFSGQVPSSLGNLTQLKCLALSQNNFSVQHSRSMSFLARQTKLAWLDLQDINLIGDIPSWLMNLAQLTYLFFDNNKLTGPIPYWLGNLNQLALLSLKSNQITGHIPSQIWNLTHLTVLDLSSNNLSLHTSTSVTVLPKLVFIGLGSCNLNKFPNFLQSQDQLELLDLSSNNIAGQIPKWLLNVSTGSLEYLNVSYNLLTGFDQHPVVLPWIRLSILDLRFNKLQGPLPIPPVSTSHYLLSSNRLTGEISPWICKLNNLYSLDLSTNDLSGVLPECLGNKFHGIIPQTFVSATNLRMIDLSHNLLQGRIPRSLANCELLEFLDLGNNQITDIFPSWLETLPELKVLILQSNRFHGVIGEPETHFAFPKLHIIDLSHNRFTGKLPSKYFHCWNAIAIVNASQLTYMQDRPRDSPTYNHSLRYIYDFSITITNKGIEMEYRKVSNILKSIILSNNRFEGEIPAAITFLKGLNCLNLSNNNLQGGIPSSLGNLTALESLDLSNNMLSDNHLSGPIPVGKQFDTFENSSFDGNPGLCGKPLSKKCESSETSLNEDHQDSESPIQFGWKIVVIGYASGFIIGMMVGQIFTKRKHEWLAKTFGVQLKRSKRQRRQRN